MSAPCRLGWLIPLTLLAAVAVADDRPARPLAQRASWQVPTIESVRERTFEWLTEREATDEVGGAAENLWDSSASGGNQPHPLDLVVATLAAADPKAAELVAFCSRPRQQVQLAEVAWLADEAILPLERDNLRLLYARWLIGETLYDEAAEQLAGLSTDIVADPAALLFYQAVVHHRMLKRDEGMAAIDRLLENEQTIPKRYASLAKLMQADLDGLKDDSLDHIARRMEDIERRLDLGRAGPKVREVEDGVIASLDKLIEQMEQQQQAAAAAAAAAQGRGGSQQAPSQPLPDSMPMQGKGPGNVANKAIGKGSGWGDLPPRERDESLQQIGQEFPAHYRDMIEQYFRKLATENEAEK